MTRASVNWLVYGEWGVPVWAAALGGAVILYFALRWIGVEKRNRKGFLARSLPWTLSLFWILVALFAWHPVVVRIVSWEAPARVIVLADESASMDQPLAGPGTASRLQALQFWQPSACAGRSLAARQLLAVLAGLRLEGLLCVEALDRLESQAEQGLPPEETLRLRQGELAKRLKEDRDAWMRLMDALLRDLDSLPGGAVQEWTRGLDAFGKSWDGLLADFEKRPAREAAEALRGLMAAMTAVEPVLEASQQALDQAFMNANAEQLEPLMKSYGARTRLDAAREALKRIAVPGLLPERYDGRRDATDLYGLVDRALDRYRNEQVSQVILLSDGGHNGPADDAVQTRLKEEKIRLQVWGVGISEAGQADFAIADWTAPLLVRANRTVDLQAVVRTAAPTGAPFTVTLKMGQAELATVPGVADGLPEQTLGLSFKAPAPGRHVVRLEVRGAEDRDPANNSVLFGFDTVERMPDMMLIGSVPDWDAAYLKLAAERAGVKLNGVFTEGKEPRRGSVGASLPEEESHWFRNQAVILGGPVFPGFSEGDAESLFKLVAEKGGSLMILPESDGGYGHALAARFGWTPGQGRLAAPALRLHPSAARLPLFRLGVDAAQSERQFAEWGPCKSAIPVPPQDGVLVETASGEPVCSIGFYGRGKVVMWGLRGMAPMRAYARARQVDRLLDFLVAELGTPVFPAGSEAGVALYPSLPAAGAGTRLIQADTNAATVLADGQPVAMATVLADGQPVAMAEGRGNRIGRPAVGGSTLTLTVDGAARVIPVAANPGMENVYPDYNPSFLEKLAAGAGGEFRSLVHEANPLGEVAPGRPQSVKTADVFRVGGHPALLLLLVFTATLHWALRKLAGLVI